MLIETYKGIEIFHNAVKDEFYTNIIIRKAGGFNKKNEYIRESRLQRIRDEIDKFINTAAKKPLLKKAWHKGRYSSDFYNQVEVILYNKISGYVMVRDVSGKESTMYLSETNYRYSDDKLYIRCKENDAIIAKLMKNKEAIEKIQKEQSCSGGKLIPFTSEHFKN